MRETCARVLAAALMAGAIATVVWMAALAGTPNDEIRPLAAPAAPQPLSVTIRVKPVKKQSTPVRRVRRTAPAVNVRAAPPVVAATPLAVAHPPRSKRPVRHLASKTPAPSSATKVTPVATPTPTPAAPTPVEPVDEHGNGHAYGHDKARGKGHEQHEE